ncbi:MAG: DUF1836 domain-containing protein [Eubacterium sp.]|nr:DUF1836 domain-containing protein [Eubacterium sp.]
MNKDIKDELLSLLSITSIPSEDIPNIELYIDQVTTFIDSRLDKSRRYPDDKIMTRTMVNNYTKNKLLPPSVKKKYSREHFFLLIMIYYLKNVLSIADIQTVLEPLSEKWFPKDKKSGLSLQAIYDKITETSGERLPDIEEEIFRIWEESQDSFADFDLKKEDQSYLDTFAFICQLCFDIYVRKQMIERVIDRYRDSHPEPPKKKK